MGSLTRLADFSVRLAVCGYVVRELAHFLILLLLRGFTSTSLNSTSISLSLLLLMMSPYSGRASRRPAGELSVILAT